MNFWKSTFGILAIVLASPAVPAGEPVWPKDSASGLSLSVALQRYQIQADYCSARIPQLKPKFESVMEDLNSRAQGILKGLLASDVFKGVQDKQVPAEIIFALKDTLDDAEHNLERQEAATICPKALQKLGEADDESLKARLSELLTAVQAMIRNVEKASAQQAPPDNHRRSTSP